MDNETATGLMDFRESHGGTLSGMTRYTDHLDDMPAIGCEGAPSLTHSRARWVLPRLD